MEFLVAHSKDLVIRSTNFYSLTEHRRLAIQQCQSQTYQRWEQTPPGASCGASVSIFVIPMAQILRSVLPDTFCTSSMYNLSITIPNILKRESDRFIQTLIELFSRSFHVLDMSHYEYDISADFTFSRSQVGILWQYYIPGVEDVCQLI